MRPFGTVLQFRLASRKRLTISKNGGDSMTKTSIINRIQGALVATFLAVVISPSTLAQDAVADYMLHAGDKIEVSVWKEPDLQRKMTVRPDGRFTFPLTGDVQAAGRSTEDIRADIETRLKRYIAEPVVTVVVEEAAGSRVYVIGQVNRPGMFVMNPRLNVLQALSLAGGTTAFAKLDDISVLRGYGSSQRTLPFRYSNVVEGKSLDQNIILESGDVVIVP
jgi:polysaccharide export outer membrane protein